jgi:para-aminobenzoate synthetase
VAAVKTLLIDNYDSFTFNLFQLLAEVNGEEPVVVRNDGATWPELARGGFDNIVVSPGPGRPQHAADLGVGADAIRCAEVPLLGVCLGHQGLAYFSGGAVTSAPEVMHGRLSRVLHDGSPLFAGIPQGFRAVRYHSLCVPEPLPDELEPIAWTPDGVLMAIARRDRAQWGVQFHPESICTEHGRRLLANFRDLTLSTRRRPAAQPRACAPSVVPRPRAATHSRRTGLRLQVARLDSLPDTERAFVHLFGGERHAFWLDSGRADDGRARFSFMGAGGGPLSAFVTYDVATRTVRIERAGATEARNETIFDFLRSELDRIELAGDELPFDLDCGFVGWLGYELKADCGARATHASSLPDAALLLADRLVAFDHRERRTYVLGVSGEAGGSGVAEWISHTCRRLRATPSAPSPALPRTPSRRPPVVFRLSRSREGYLEDIRRCQDYLREGESYEVCLTNRIATDAAPDPLLLYRTLRRLNPAPFSAFLRFGDVAVVSSSPERFLRVGRDRRVEAKPIKGTTRRGECEAEDARLAEELRGSEKNRAENLMITDLLRNDLGVVCEVGSVVVPHLMEIESFETVHQLVSTIAGRLRPGLAAADCIEACFPGGSMTGAPKLRTLEIIDELEREARGVYSGAIGYLGLGGACDLNIVIRTIVLERGRSTIGAGGAIVMQSDPDEELEELLLKAEAPMRALALCSGGSPRWRLLDPEEPRTGLAAALQEA